MDKRPREWSDHGDDDDDEYVSGRHDSWRRFEPEAVSSSADFGKGKGKGKGKGGDWGKGKGKGDDWGKGKGKGKGKGGGKGSLAPTYRLEDIGKLRLEQLSLAENTESCGVIDMNGSVKKQQLEIMAATTELQADHHALVPVGAVTTQPAEALLNYFPVQIEPGQQAFVYSVEFRPPFTVPATTDNTKLRTYLVMKGLEEMGRTMDYDAATVVYAGGPQLFAPQPFPFEEVPYQLRDGQQGVVYLEMVRIMNWDTITPEHQFVIANVFQAGLRQLPNRCRIGRVTYDLRPRCDIPLFRWEDRQFGRLRLLAGPTSRLLATDRGPMLVIDVSARVKQEETVKTLLEWGASQDEFVGRYGIVSYNQKAFVIQAIDTKVKPTDKFPWRKGGVEREVSYIEYVREKYAKHIPPNWQPDLRQPMVVEYDKRRNQTNYYLAEFVHPCGLSSGMKKNTDFMRDLRDRVGGNPSWRAWLMERLVLPAADDPQAAPFWRLLEAWGLKLSSHFTHTEVQELPQQRIAFGDKTVTPSTEGKWDVFEVATRENRQMARPPPPTAGFVLHADWDGQSYFQEMAKKAQAMGFRLDLQPWKLDPREYCSAVLAERQTPALLCAQMLRKDESPGNPYDALKSGLTLNAGIVTQCGIPGGKALGVKAQMAAVQVCAKLGGVPWAVPVAQTALPARGTLVLGFDLAHSKKRGDEHSLMGVVATLDAECLRCWHTVKEIQLGSTVLDPAGLHDAVNGAVQAYQALHRQPPERVVVVRNGVGESQYGTMGRQEVMVVKEEVEKACGPVPLLVLLTIKDTRARVFKVDRGAVVNPVPGTVVSGGTIRNSAGYDEFLVVAHGTTQGTVQPLKIVVLHNSIPGLPLVDVQRFVVQLCCNYFNFFGAVKMPSPIMYASKLLKFIQDHRRADGRLCLPLPVGLQQKLFYL
eukprot:EG_transcript_1884